MKQAVILAGGRGSRLQNRLGGRPKPLVDIDGIPLLARQILLLREHGFDDVAVLVSYLPEQVHEYCAANRNFGIELRIIDEGAARGTAGAVLAALQELAERFLVIYGDTLLNVDLGRLWHEHAVARADATLFLHPNSHPHDSDIVETDEDGWIRAIHASPHPSDRYLPNLVNAALYVLERAPLEPWRNFPIPADFAKHLFPSMLKAGHRLLGYVSFEYIHDVGTPARLDAAVAHLRSGRVARASLAQTQKAVFADRDGTLNVKRDYVRSPQELEVIEGVPAAVQRLNEAEFRVVVVTNQPVLARGECSAEQLRQIHAKLEAELARGGAFVDRILYCPHHPESGFAGEVPALKIDCACRKPKTALIEQATRELNIERSLSWCIGDSSADILMARRAGLTSILVRTGAAGRDGKFKAMPHFIVDDFAAAVALILDVYPRLAAAVTSLCNRIEAGDVVLIGGLARAGKTTLAQVLSMELAARGLPAAVIGLDSWIRPLAERDGDVMQRFDLALAGRTLAPWFEASGPVRLRLPIYDRFNRQRSIDHDELELTRGTVLVLEGVPTLAMSIPGTRRAHRIHVEIDEQARRERVLSDLLLRGSPVTEAHAIYSGRQRDEAPIVAQLRAKADLVVDVGSGRPPLL